MMRNPDEPKPAHSSGRPADQARITLENEEVAVAVRGPPKWWADWVKVKRDLVRTDGQAYDASEATVYAACTAHELPPICPQSTFVFGSVAEGQARFSGASFDGERPFSRVYSRLGNPTSEALETTLLDLECGYVQRKAAHNVGSSSSSSQQTVVQGPMGALVTASGMGAISAVLMSLLSANDHIIIGTVYGCTHSLMKGLCAQFGIVLHLVSTTDLAHIREILDQHGDRVRCVYVESIENPTMQLADLAGISALTEPRGVPLVVDNTFATPYNTQPFRLGADIVVHSTTKYINGHSTAVGGAILGPWGFVMADCFGWYKDLGATPSAFDCWNILQVMQDLPLRVSRQAASASELAQFLEQHPRVSRVLYPGLKSHPHHELAIKQMRTGGGMISFEVSGGYNPAVRLMDFFASLQHGHPLNQLESEPDAQPLVPAHLCVSLGSVSTYLQHPASMTHKCVPPVEREAMGITDALVRVSVGIDDPEALKATFEHALAYACEIGESVPGA